MGGKHEQLIFKPLIGADDVRALFGRFDAAKAQCMKRRDKEKLLGVIESSFGELMPFSLLIRKLFAPEVAEEAGSRRTAFGKAPSSLFAGPAARVLPKRRTQMRTVSKESALSESTLDSAEAGDAPVGFTSVQPFAS